MKLIRWTVRQRFYLFTLLAVTLSILALTFIGPVHAQGDAAGAGRHLPAQTTYTAYFSDLTFGAASDGPAITYFPVGTTQVFARWNYANIPVESRLRREWYIDGKLFIQKEEAWNFTDWGSTGRLTHISIYDFTEGLTPGYYHVVISLVPNYPAAQVTGDFVIADYPATVVPSINTASFSNLTVSTSAAGPAMSVFPAGTPLISARWDYANIPVGAMMQRDWYLNGVLFRSVQEPWSAYWGSSGRLTHVAIYDYEQGMASGDYRLVIYLRDNPGVRAETTFTIGDTGTTVQANGPTLFFNLTFSTSPDGPATAIFPRGTREVFARWDFNFVSPDSVVLRRWYRNGVLWLERQEAWVYGVQGRVKNISIYDYQNGLPPGDYVVEFSLIGFPNSVLRGYFTIS
jgi:hypothetical protein